MILKYRFNSFRDACEADFARLFALFLPMAQEFTRFCDKIAADSTLVARFPCDIAAFASDIARLAAHKALLAHIALLACYTLLAHYIPH